MVNLVLKGITNQLDIYSRNKFVTDSWYAFLKEYRMLVEDAPDKNKAYTDLLIEHRMRFENEVKAEIYTAKEIAVRKKLLDDIEEAGRNIEKQMEPKEAFDNAKSAFMKATEVLEESESVAIKYINNAFEFIEDAFSNGQELVVFVTELTILPNAALFLSEHEIEKYNVYKEELLIGTRKAEILEVLK